MQCGQCGKLNKVNASKCKRCGATMSSVEGAPTSLAVRARQSPLAGVAAILGLLLAVVRIATCAARTEANNQRDRIADQTTDLHPAPSFTCDMECELALRPFGSTDPVDPSSLKRCTGACITAKTNMPDMDFPATYRRCNLPCMMQVAATEDPLTDRSRRCTATASSRSRRARSSKRRHPIEPPRRRAHPLRARYPRSRPRAPRHTARAKRTGPRVCVSKTSHLALATRHDNELATFRARPRPDCHQRGIGGARIPASSRTRLITNGVVSRATPKRGIMNRGVASLICPPTALTA